MTGQSAKLFSAFTLAAGAVLAIIAPALAQSGVFVADNSYVVYVGSSGGATTYVDSHTCDSVQVPTCHLDDSADWSSSLPVTSLNDTVYVVAFSDGASAQGLLALVEDWSGKVYNSGDAGWQVCATGDRSASNWPNSPAGPGKGSNPGPGFLGKLNSEITKCNSEGGWTTPALSGSPSPTHPISASSIKGFGTTDRWMWHDAVSSTDTGCNNTHRPFRPGCFHDEYLIFRLPVQAEPKPCVEFSQVRVQCQNGPLGPSGCYEVRVRVTNNSGAPASHMTLWPYNGWTTESNVIAFANPSPGPIPAYGSRDVTFVVCPPPGVVPRPPLSVDIGLTDSTGETCCSQRLPLLELPDCPSTSTCFQVPRARAECLPGGPPGAFKLMLDVSIPMGKAPLRMYTLADPPAVVVPNALLFPQDSASPFAVELEVFGAPANTRPRRFCMWLQTQPDVDVEAVNTPIECCAEYVCVTVPYCGLPEPTPDPNP